MAQALTRRLGQLYLGLVLYGFSMALLVRARLGVMPWDVLHQGVARTIGGTLGTVSIVVGALVLLLWIPLRQRPGVGTVSNVLVIGLAVDASLAVLPHVDGMVLRVALVVAGDCLSGCLLETSTDGLTWELSHSLMTSHLNDCHCVVDTAAQALERPVRWLRVRNAYGGTNTWYDVRAFPGPDPQGNLRLGFGTH